MAGDVAAAVDFTLISALIRDAVDALYGDERSLEQDLAIMRRAGGSWADRDLDGAAWVEQLRSGRRLGGLQ